MRADSVEARGQRSQAGSWAGRVPCEGEPGEFRADRSRKVIRVDAAGDQYPPSPLGIEPKTIAPEQRSAGIVRVEAKDARRDRSVARAGPWRAGGYEAGRPGDARESGDREDRLGRPGSTVGRPLRI